jgi:hypothetical protein
VVIKNIYLHILIKMGGGNMNLWGIAAIVLAVVVITGVAVVNAISVDDNTDTAKVCGASCGNSCTATSNCGLSTCGATKGGSCTCGN